MQAIAVRHVGSTGRRQYRRIRTTLRPDYAAIVTYGNLAPAFVMTAIVASFSSNIGVRKVLKIEPFDIFRG